MLLLNKFKIVMTWANSRADTSFMWSCRAMRRKNLPWLPLFLYLSKDTSTQNSKLTCCQDRKSQMLYKILTFDIEKRKKDSKIYKLRHVFFRNSNNGVVSPRIFPQFPRMPLAALSAKAWNGYRTTAASGVPESGRFLDGEKNLTTWDVHPQLPVGKSSKRTEPSWLRKTCQFSGVVWVGFSSKKKQAFNS